MFSSITVTELDETPMTRLTCVATLTGGLLLVNTNAPTCGARPVDIDCFTAL